MARFLTGTIFWSLILVSANVRAQPRVAQVEASATAGYAERIGGGPDLGTVGGGLAVWVSRRFGLAWGMSIGPGMKEVRFHPTTNQLEEPQFPQRAGDRKLIESGHLFLQRVTFRYRRSLWPSADLVLGGGLLIEGHFRSVDLVADTLADIRRAPGSIDWNGLSYRVLLRQKLANHLAVESGVVADFALDLWYQQPVIRMTVVF